MSEAIHHGHNGVAVRPVRYDPAESWPHPDARLLNGGPRKAPAFPMEALGDWGGRVADLAASKRAPVDYVAVPLLGFAAGIVGAARDVRIEQGWREPCVLWVAAIGNPSSGKSPPLATLKRAAIAVERIEGADLSTRKREFETAKAEQDALLAHWEAQVKEAVKAGKSTPERPSLDELDEPHPPRIVAADATREALAMLCAKRSPRGVALALDELMALLGNFGKFGGRDEPFYLSAYSGDFAPVDRKTSETLLAPRAYISIVGAIQPDLVQTMLEGRSDDGLISRFLPVWPDPQQHWLRKVPQTSEAWVETLFRRLRSLRMDTDADGAPCPREVELCPDAADIFFEWCAEQHTKANAAHGFMAGFLGKSRGMCARVALVLQLIDWAMDPNGDVGGPPVISADAMERACILFADYFEPMARRVYADVSAPPAERAAIALLKEITTRGARQFNAREAQREWGVPNLSSAANMDAALEVLSEGDCIRRIEREDKGGPGRKPKIYAVNPRLWVAP